MTNDPNYYQLSISPIEIPKDKIHLFKVNGNFNSQNAEAINWLCTKIENGQVSLNLDVFNDEWYENNTRYQDD